MSPNRLNPKNFWKYEYRIIKINEVNKDPRKYLMILWSNLQRINIEIDNNGKRT